jgi:hypothetical protein
MRRLGVRLSGIFSALLAISLWGGVNEATAADSAEPIDFAKQLRPILKARCTACHGTLKQSSGLRLDSAAGLIRGGDSGAGIVRGKSNESELIQRISTEDPAVRMPPEGEPLTSEQVNLFRRWIDAGAEVPAQDQPDLDPRDHWAFRPVQAPPAPENIAHDWVLNPIDASISAGHLRQGLTPLPAADRLLLLRRVSLDLIGLPPSSDEIAQVLSAEDESWYERTVERLLADPRHGERWGRHFMDVWRYSDWWGLGDQLRNSQKHIWHWRDWIIESLNADLPYDEMIRLMLAADESHPTDLDRLRATGFLARNYFLFNRNQWMDEVVEHVAKGFLGLTMNCAKCHDHKYDPITQQDYYRMRAFFEPYHVRVDMLPGETDLNRNGLPRVFDGLPDLPTYLFVRGNENAPDKSQSLAPDVPQFLRFRELPIRPIELPKESFDPGSRPWVAEGLLRTARERISQASARLEAKRRTRLEAGERLAAATKSPADEPGTDPQPGAELLVHETFQDKLGEQWRLFGGDWKYGAEGLSQNRDGAQRSVLRLLTAAPRDFEATLKFTIHGGSQWRSIGFSFDVTTPDPTQPEGPQDSEQNVYASAYAQGPKVQAAWHRGGAWQFPGEGASQRPIELEKPHVLKLQVRNQLINATLDGNLAVAYRTPLERKDAAFQIITFDCLATLHDMSLAPLSPTAPMAEPGTPQESPQDALISAQWEEKGAEFALALAEAEVASLEQRAAAQRSSPGAERFEELVKSAAVAEHQARVQQAELVIAERELQRHRATPDKREAADKALSEARMALEKARSNLANPGTQFTPLPGAAWTPTRFFNSTQDDPTVTFPSQSTGRRTALAEWITDPAHPLTARVLVNQVWTRHIGAPLTGSVFDFGLKSPPPAHRDLVDWLAADFIAHGWSLKHLHRQIVLSQTYRLRSDPLKGRQELVRDPDNHWFWKRPNVRLESQAVRDAILSLAGQLEFQLGGPPVASAAQDNSRRRSLYFFHSNNERNLFLTTFDEALVKECYRREQSVVPQQALALSNSGLVLDACQLIARRLRPSVPPGDSRETDDETFVTRAYQVLLGTVPEPTERSLCVEALQGWRSLPDWKGGSEAADAQLIWVLLNHSDFVTVQ